MNFSSYNTFSLVVEQVKQNSKIHTSIGRLRFLIRACLVRKCLHMPIEILVRHLSKYNHMYIYIQYKQKNIYYFYLQEFVIFFI